MTNNKTIVDSVDVSECEHQTCGGCDINFEEWNGEIIRYLDCSNYPNCYFKQLKRKEQKLDKIKDYCLKNKASGWCDVEGIIGIIEGKENE